ncbi:MAG: enoyl-CoA hydratase/isomerase family protein [Clostridiales bacterium]|nr:enoyl-CoA hydratase/isomerase family protein [Clostridiales bacterium]
MKYPYRSLLIQISQGVAFVKLNSAANLYTITDDPKRELSDFLLKARENKRIRVILLTGSGRIFYVGGNLKPERTAIATGDRERGQQKPDLPSIIEDIHKPVIAAVNGYAIGAGVHLALACDIRIASENAVFYFIQAKNRSQYTSHRVDAAEALQSGVVTKIVEEKALIETAMRIARSIANGQTLSLVYTLLQYDAG